MKKIALLLLLVITPLLAQDDPFYPFSVSGSYLGVGEAKFHTTDVEGQKLRYTQVDGAFTFIYPFNPVCGLLFGAAYIGSDVDWKENPDFNETRFNYINFSVGGFTKSYDRWLWTGTAGIFIDTEEFDLHDYAIYQGVLQGKYELNDWTIINFGFIFEAGLNQEHIWPIIGFELFPSENWRLNVVYPMNLKYEYFIWPELSVAASVRIIRNLHRVKDTEPLPKGIFEYQTWGGELDLLYNPFAGFFIKGFAGSTFRGDLKVTDRSYNNAVHYKFDGSFFGGGTVSWNF